MWLPRQKEKGGKKSDQLLTFTFFLLPFSLGTEVASLTFDLKTYLTAKQQLVDRRLADLLAKETHAPSILLDAMRYSLLAPGKRLRPALVFMAAQAAGGVDSQALPGACAIEMIHTYSLVHDDLPAMDDDDLRRGMPTCHKKYGEALAILAGDALLTLAFQMVAEHCSPKSAAASCRALAQGSGLAGMVGGQVEDLAWESANEATGRAKKDPLFPRSDGPRTLETLEHIHLHKTGALFRTCMKLGVLAAQDDPDRGLLDRLDLYARCFGLAFQITDDLIDVEGNAADTGKNVNKDAARGKLTYPILLGVAESRKRARDLAQQGLDAIQPIGAAVEPLVKLMDYVLKRDR
ncbi:MAG: polyprenyl synthetase family protein [Planctomycetes bacterium]|nr:polyprenyl synthetase family protein [Planctomycetota bacterium]